MNYTFLHEKEYVDINEVKESLQSHISLGFVDFIVYGLSNLDSEKVRILADSGYVKAG